jgi:hypothetical protein
LEYFLFTPRRRPRINAGLLIFSVHMPQDLRDQQAPPFQNPHNTPAEGVEQSGQFIIGGPAGAVKLSAAITE